MQNYDDLRLNSQVCFPLYACSKELSKQYSHHLKDINLTYTQFLVMMVLWERETVSSRELSDVLHLDYGTLTPVLKKLSSMGYVEKNRLIKDERQLSITLTKEGKHIKKEALDIPKGITEAMGLSKEEIKTLYRLTYKALKHMEAGS